MQDTERIIRRCVETSGSRLELWSNLINGLGARNIIEIGVYRGDFAAHMLSACDAIERYGMIDPWRHLNDWDKPANKQDDVFEQFFQETMQKTDFASDKRQVHRGKTTEVMDQIPESSVDLAYIDGDHTLKGIAIDLIQIHARMRDGGFIGGDDLSKTIWQHGTAHEPTMVFPFTAYFAEAISAHIFILPYNQFIMTPSANGEYAYTDLTGRYPDTSMKSQLRLGIMLKYKISEKLPFVRKGVKSLIRLLRPSRKRR